MKTVLTQNCDLSPKELAKVLVTARPEEFAEFWFSFAEQVKGNDSILQEFAKEMAPDFGGMRKQAFRKLDALITFYEMQEKIIQKDTDEEDDDE